MARVRQRRLTLVQHSGTGYTETAVFYHAEFSHDFKHSGTLFNRVYAQGDVTHQGAARCVRLPCDGGGRSGAAAPAAGGGTRGDRGTTARRAGRRSVQAERRDTAAESRGRRRTARPRPTAADRRERPSAGQSHQSPTSPLNPTLNPGRPSLADSASVLFLRLLPTGVA